MIIALSEARAKPPARALKALATRSAREQAALLRATREDIKAALGKATGFRRFHLTDMLTEINRLMARGRSASQRMADDAIRQAFGLGTDVTRNAIRAAGARVEIPDTLYGISREILDALIDVTRDQTRAVWNELGSRLKRDVRRAALGVVDPYDAMKSVASVITNPKIFGTPIARAEVIIRTEVGRTFSVGQHRANVESDARLRNVGQTIKKYWQTTKDDRTREHHLQAGRDYTRAHAIPFDEPFIVDGEPLMYPLDPNGSAGNTINCRCNSQAVVTRL